MTEAARQRLFFALWPDDNTRSAFARLAKAGIEPTHGRLVPTPNLHLTLVFLGAVDAKTRACAERAAHTLSAAAFELQFQCLGHWRRSGILWSAPKHTPERLRRLVTALREALAPCGHSPESRTFHAHVSLARKARGPLTERAHPLVRWPVSDFHLLVSESTARGVRYRSLERWSLE